MSPNRETSQDPFKSWKIFTSTADRSGGEISCLLIKAALFVFLFASIYLAFFSAFTNQTSWFRCPECDGFLRNFGRKAKIPVKLVVDDHHQGNEPTNISHIQFGIGGSVKSWKDRRHYSELWWKPNITRGFVWLDQPWPENETWLDSSPPYQVSEDSSRFKYTSWYGTRSAVRIARIVLESFRLGLDNVRWFVMGDDDTVFFVENLVTVLSKYDHRQMYYIGGNSESVEQDVIHSYGMAYGGGGFAISYPLAAELVRVLDGCIDRYASFYGSDQKIQACLTEIGVPVTREPGFHQVDIRGDPYGILAAHPMVPLVSLHHLDYVKPLFPEEQLMKLKDKKGRRSQVESLKKLREAYEVDPGRTLQQSICYDLERNWSLSIGWGFTAQLYPTLVTAKELQTTIQTFQTWRSWSSEPFTFNTRKLSSDQCERPLFYFFDEVELESVDRTLTTYDRFVSDPKQECTKPHYASVLGVQSIKVLASRLNPNHWKKAPRRQCCDIMKVGNVLEARIRSCYAGESVTPH